MFELVRSWRAVLLTMFLCVRCSGECVLSVTPRQKADGMELNFQQVPRKHTDMLVLDLSVPYTLSISTLFWGGDHNVGVCVCRT